MKKYCLLTQKTSNKDIHINHYKYAKNHNLDFKVVKNKSYIYDKLNEYNRIIYLSNTTIIRNDCPNLFNIVPKTEIGLFNETTYTKHNLEIFFSQYHNQINPAKDKIDKYYNTDIIVISKKHQFLCNKAPDQFEEILNVNIFNHEINIKDIEYMFNTMSFVTEYTGFPRQNSYIINYKGVPNEELFNELLYKDIFLWNEKQYNLPRNVLLKLGGGIGDQIDIEPLIRYLRINKLKPKDNLVVVSHYPILFKHLLNDKTITQLLSYEDKINQKDIQYLKFKTMPEINDHSFKCSHTSIHTVDYASLNILGKILPTKDKQIQLKIQLKNLANLYDMVGTNDFSNTILVHAGKGWDSKTFPKEYWNEIVQNILDLGKKVILIGKKLNDKQGYVNIDIENNNIMDLRDILNLNDLITIISQCPILLSNDSCPIHIAGAFDNDIICIATCKHPEYIMPWRKGSQKYKNHVLYKKLLCEDFKADLNKKSGDTIDNIPSGNIMDYLPLIEKIINKIKRIDNG